MKNFQLKGICAPGRVNLPGHGTINLVDISDELAEKLYKEGLPYLEPIPKYRPKLFPGEQPIDNAEIEFSKKSQKGGKAPAAKSAKPAAKRATRRTRKSS